MGFEIGYCTQIPSHVRQGQKSVLFREEKGGFSSVSTVSMEAIEDIVCQSMKVSQGRRAGGRAYPRSMLRILTRKTTARLDAGSTVNLD